MTSWLKWRLMGLFGVATLLSSGYWLQAQETYPPPAKTPEAAAEMFFQLLSGVGKQGIDLELQYTSGKSGPYMGAISKAQTTEVLKLSPYGGMNRLLELLAAESQIPQFLGHITRSEGGKTIVGVLPAPASKGREVVIIPEDGGYRVDLKATLSQWNNLSGLALDEAWFKYTGLASPALRAINDFGQEQCQSNLKELMLSIKQYTQDYDERLPRARAWQDGLFLYHRKPLIYTCPALPESKANGYAFNQKLSQFPEAHIESPAETVNLYETSNLTHNTFGVGTGRAYRHLEGSNIAFVDGHVKWYKRDTERRQPVTFEPK